MKELISLDGNGNKVRFLRGNDGDIHISFDVPEKKVFLDLSELGLVTPRSGRPIYVKQTLNTVCDAMERWDNEGPEGTYKTE